MHLLSRITASKRAHVAVGQQRFPAPCPAVALCPYRVAVIDHHHVNSILSADGVEIRAGALRRFVEQGCNGLHAAFALGHLSTEVGTAVRQAHRRAAP